MTVKITLVIDNFTHTQDVSNFPSLIYLIEHHHVTHDSLDINSILFNLFGHHIKENSLPIAALSGLGENLPVQEDWWLRADPVELLLDGAAIYMLGNSHIEFSEDKILPIRHKIADYFAAENIKLYTPKLNEWYLHLTEDPGIQTYSIAQTLGKHIHSFLPAGANRKKWLRILTEVQMLFYAEKLNQEKNTVNSLWFWGEGRSPTQSASCCWQEIWNDTTLGNGLARYNNMPILEPVNFDNCLREMIKGDYLIILNATKHKDLETSWFAPMLAAFKRKRINSVEFYLDNGKFYQSNQKSILGWWRSLLPLRGRSCPQD